MTSVRCQACGGAHPTRSMSVTVPVTDYRGHPLPVPGVHFLCRHCAAAVGRAEKAQRHATHTTRTPEREKE